MAKGKRMTLKQAAEFLKTTEYPYGFEAVKKAVKKGKLKVQLVSDAPLPYYLVSEDDLIAWASDDSQHRAGRPAKGKE
jgi:hypothetical protein